MRQMIRNKVADVLLKQVQEPYELFYSSLLDQLYILYIALAGAVLLLFAHLSLWPVLALLVYLVAGYLFGAYRNYSFALTSQTLYCINGRKPFVKRQSIALADIKEVSIRINEHPILDRIFIIPSNICVHIYLQNGEEQKYYTNIDYAADCKEDELSLEQFIDAIFKRGIKASLEEQDAD
jgi:hypothetical protein